MRGAHLSGAAQPFAASERLLAGRRTDAGRGEDAGVPTRILSTLGLPEPGGAWTALPGGRVNRVWRVETAAGPIAIKRYGPLADRGLFPNEPEAEYAALAAGWRARRAPQPLALVDAGSGPVLAYRYLPSLRAVDPAEAGAALAALHRAPPWPGLAQLARDRWSLPPGWQGRLRRAGVSAPACRAVAAAAHLAEALPAGAVPLHGDPVPANLLATAHGTVLIDWQCPSLGDAATDLALYLSAAMQRRYGTGPLSALARARLLAGYGHAAGLARYRLIAPALHARIALYCAAIGDRAAARAEAALVNRLVAQR